jgi:parvulin-like peptidyl-prolyl isomerase
MKRMVKALIVFSAVFAAGCSSAPAPNTRLASSQAAVRGAREVGAESVPQASLHLKFSEEQIAQARALIAEGDNERADLVLQQAQADAELALSLARESVAITEAQRVMAQVQQLRGGK